MVAASRRQGRVRKARTAISGIHTAMAQGNRPDSRAVISGDSSSTTHSMGMPDQYSIVSIKAPNTRDVPRSGWMNTSSQGIEITLSGRSRSTGRSTGWRARTAASRRMAAILANSEGCTFTGPMLIQRWAPRAVVPIRRTAIRLRTVRPYTGINKGRSRWRGRRSRASAITAPTPAVIQWWYQSA